MVARSGLDKTGRSIAQGACPQLTMAVVVIDGESGRALGCAVLGGGRGREKAGVGRGYFYARFKRPDGNIKSGIIDR